MNEKLLEKLSVVTEEEKSILSGGAIDKKLYTDAGDFTVKSGKISDAERLVDMRPHTRFSPFPKHRHNYIEMIYTCLGVTRHTVNGSDEIVLKAGDILLLGTNAVHEVAAASEKDIAVNFIIRPEFFTVTLGEAGYGNTVYDMIVKELTSDGDASFLLFGVSGVLPIQNLVENLIYSFLTESDGNYAVRNTTMGLILAELSGRSEFIADSSSLRYDKEIIFKTLKYIDGCFKEAKLSVLAGNLKMTTVTLSKTIKKYTGDSFKMLLQKKRLREAEKLIRNTYIPITDIIYSVGYENTNFFYRLFGKTYGYSPKAYRKIFSPQNKERP